MYHLTPRGNDGRTIFTEDAERVHFLLLLNAVAQERRWIVYGYCLMGNHLHLLVQVPELGLSEGMQRLLGGYSQWWNSKHEGFGHAFVNRFPSKPVHSDAHLRETARYIDLNPVRARLTPRAEQWAWSSYRAHIGLGPRPPFLANARFLELFGPTPERARKAYRRFVREGARPGSDGLDLDGHARHAARLEPRHPRRRPRPSARA